MPKGGIHNLSSRWHFEGGSGTQVHLGAPPVSFTDMDLSGWIGSRPALVVLSISIASARYVSFRPNGNTDDFTNGSNNPAGCTSIVTEASGVFKTIICPTDDDGIVEWICNSAASGAEVNLLGWIA